MKTLSISLLVFATAVAIPVYGIAYIQYIRNSIYGDVYDELETHPAIGDIQVEWHNLSYSGENPLRVIALATKTTEDMNLCLASERMTSAFYSQVKHLARKGRVLTAAAFFLESRKWSRLTLERKYLAKGPINFEVVGAPDFMLATIPVVGLLFKDSALGFLRVEEEYLKHQKADPIKSAMVYSKIYRLTSDESYKRLVQLADLKRDMHQGDLLRIAKHLGFQTREELYTFCGI